MVLLGGMRRGLLDGRTEEEKLAELAQLMNPYAAKPAGFGIGPLYLAGPDGGPASDAPMLPAPAAKTKLLDGLGVGTPDQQPPRLPDSGNGLDGPWSSFMPGAQAPISMGDPLKAQAKTLALRDAPRNGFDGLPSPTTPPRLGDAVRRPAPWDQKPGWGEGLSALGQSLMAAQASIDGNFEAASTILQNQAKARLDLRRRAELGNAMRQQGYSDAQIMMALSDPESIGKNYNERLGTRVVAPGSSIVTGGPQGQRPTYSQPHAFESYAAAQGLQPGTPAHTAAMQDYTLRQYGPTGTANLEALDDARTGNKIKFEGVQQSGRTGLENLRQQGRVGLEGVRQNNRITTRQTPTYGDTHPRPVAPRAAPRSNAPTGPTATGPNGQKIRWNGSAWVPA